MGRRKSALGRNFLKSAERGVDKLSPLWYYNSTERQGDTMNKRYTVSYTVRNIFTDSTYSDEKYFDDLLKMWEFVIELKKNETTEKIWITTTQVVFERKG
jgi:hypothetical protein